MSESLIQAGLLLSSACGNTVQHALLPPYPIFRRLRPHPHTKCALTTSVLCPHVLVRDATGSVACMFYVASGRFWVSPKAARDSGKRKYIFRSGACNKCGCGCGQVRTYESGCTMLRRVATCRTVLQPGSGVHGRERIHRFVAACERHVCQEAQRPFRRRAHACLPTKCRQRLHSPSSASATRCNAVQHVATQCNIFALPLLRRYLALDALLDLSVTMRMPTTKIKS